MSLDSIRTSIKTLVAGVSGISGVAPVYDYARHVTTEAEVVALLKGAGQARAHWWSVRPATEKPFTVFERMGCKDGLYRWEIHGWYALNDTAASEKAFDTIVEAVMTALLADLTLSGTVRPLEDDLPAWVANDHKQVGTSAILCHHAEITLGVKKQLP